MSGLVTEVISGVSIIDASFFGIRLEIPFLRGEKAVVIDSGIATTPHECIAPYLQSQGLGGTDVDVAAITHSHQDHFGGNAALKEMNPEIKIALHRRDVGWAEDHLRHWNQMYMIFPGQWDPEPEYRNTVLELCGPNAVIDVVLHEGDTIEVGEGLDLEVIETPGHSPGHVTFYNRENRLAFTGDAIQKRGVTVDGAPDIFALYDDVDVYTATLKRIETLEVDTLCTGHFGVLQGAEIQHCIDESRAFIDELDAAIEVELRKAGRPLAIRDVAAALHANHYPEYECLYQLHLTPYAHLQRMVSRGMALGSIVDGTKHWQLV